MINQENTKQEKYELEALLIRILTNQGNYKFGKY